MSSDADMPDLLPAGHADTGVVWPKRAPQFTSLAEPWTAAGDLAGLSGHLRSLSSDLATWIERLRMAQVLVERHNSPDLLAQLGHALRRPVDTVLCGVLDVDPAASLNSALLSRYPLELIAGVALIGQITSARRAAVVTDARVPPSWFPSLRKNCLQLGIRAEPLLNDYPQADPTLMLYSLLGRRLRPGRLPTEAGAILLDAAAAVAVGRHVLSSEPMRQVPLSIRDHTSGQSYYLIVPVGMTLAEIHQRLAMPHQGRILRAGDLLRDVQVPADTAIGAGELVFHSALPSPLVNPSPCIRCGWCVDSCPTGVQPATVLEAAQQGDLDLAEAAGIEACIECGICSYVCPSRLPLLVGIQKTKLLSARDTYAVGRMKDQG